MSADVVYYFTGVMASDFGNLSSQTSFSGTFIYDYPQTPYASGGSISIPGYPDGTSSYSLKSISLNIGNQSIYLDYSNSPLGNSYISVHNAASFVEYSPTDYFQIKIPA